MNLIEKIKSYLFNYTFIEPLAAGESYSTNIKVKKNFDKSIWAGKISNPLPDILENFRGTGKQYIRTVDFRDMDHRAMLGFRLAKLAGLKSLQTRIVPLKRVENFDEDSIKHEKIDDNIFLTEFKGQSLTSYLQSKSFATIETSDIRNKDEVIKSFVFNLWIGNYDNKDKDYLVDEANNLISIDYHLLGPGFRSDLGLALGAWGEAFDINSPPDTGWCIGNGELLNYLKTHTKDWRPFEQSIKRVNSISKLQVRFAMRGLEFYKQGTMENINDSFFDFLFERKVRLEETIRTWIDAGCPLTPLPKDDGIL